MSVLDLWVSERHIEKRPHEVLLHFKDCTHWYTQEEMKAERIEDPRLRPATDAEQVRTLDERRRAWRICRDCAAKVRRDPVVARILARSHV
jgi:hypothetical protein